MRKTLMLAFAAAVALSSAACGSDPKPEPEVAKPLDSAAKPKVKITKTKRADADADANGKAARGTPVGVDEKVAKMCNLPEARFDFDSAKVGKPAKNVLDAITKCFIDGPGKGKKLNVVGHADKRGEAGYNMALGHRRAASIAGYLTNNGIAEERVATSSMGEIEATGDGPDGWARDRKVQIFLAE